MNKKFFVVSLLLIALAALPLYGQNWNPISNPLATPAQLTAEKNATDIVATPQVQQAMQTLSLKWSALAGNVSQEQMAYLQEAVNEAAFSVALTVQSDPNYPQIVSTEAAPHSWFGTSVPGSRILFDNPDTVYLSQSIDPAASYVITGKRNPLAPVDENFSLWAANTSTIANLSGKDLVTAADGSFTITVDPTSGSGAQNHLQTTPQVATIYIRNTVNDWATQSFDSLSIERITPPAAPALGFNDWVARTVYGLSALTPSIYYLQVLRIGAQPPNTMGKILMGGAAAGTLATQAQEFSSWQITDDQALVVTVNPDGAGYFICPVYNAWFTTTDYVNHTQTLNNAQSIPNADGTYTFVIAVNDPGVYNWIDTVGMHSGDLVLRFQAMPQGATPTATAQLVNLADLSSVLPAGTKYVTPFERQLQLAVRKASYDRRYADQWVPPLYGLDFISALLQKEPGTKPSSF